MSYSLGKVSVHCTQPVSLHRDEGLPSAAPPATQKPHSKLFPYAHFSLDQLANKLQEHYYDEKGWIRKEVKLPELPPVPRDRLNLLRQELRRNLNQTSIQNLFRYFKTLHPKSKNRLRGEFLRYLLTPEWDKEALCKLLEKKDVEAYFDSRGRQQFSDIDYEHLCLESKVEALQLANRYVGERAKASGSSEDAIRGSCKRFDALLEVDPKEITLQALLMRFGTSDGPDVDFVITTVKKDPYFLTMKDLWLDLDALIDEEDPQDNLKLIPSGNCSDGWQAVLDSNCRIYKIGNPALKKWERAMSVSTTLCRHPLRLPEELYECVRLYCKPYGKIGEPIAFLLQNVLKSHHKDSPSTAVALTYNACTNLLRHGFAQEDVAVIVKGMLTGREVQSKELQAIQSALKWMPFSTVSAALEALQLLSLAEGEAFLTQDDGAAVILGMMDGQSLMVPLRPLETLATLSMSCYQLRHHPNAEPLKDLCSLIRSWRPQFGLSFDPKSPLDRYIREKDISFQGLLDLSISLVCHPSEEICLLGYQLLLQFHLMSPGKSSLARLLYHLPEFHRHAPPTLLSELLPVLLGNPKVPVEKVSEMLQRLSTPEKRTDFLKDFLIFLAEERLSYACMALWEEYAQDLDAMTHAQICLEIIQRMPDDAAKYIDFFLCLPIHNEQYNEGYTELYFKIHDYFFRISPSPRFVQSLSQLVSVDARMLRHHPSIRTEFISRGMQAVATLLHQRSQHAAYYLMLLIKNEISPVSEGVVELWISCCESLASKSHLEAFKFWKKGEDLGVWKQEWSVYEHRFFLVNFVEALYSQNRGEQDLVADAIMRRISSNGFKSEISTKLQEIQESRKKREECLQASQQDLQSSLLALEKLLKRPSEERPELVKIARNLLQRLSESNPVRSVYISNLKSARTLFANPKVQDLFSRGEFLALLVGCMGRMMQRKMDPEEMNLLVSLWEISFEYLFTQQKRQDPREEGECLKLFAQLLKRREFQDSSRLLDLILRHLVSILTLFKEQSLIEETGFLLYMVLMKSNAYHYEACLRATFWILDALPCRNYVDSSEISRAISCLTLLHQSRSIPLDADPRQQLSCFLRCCEYLFGQRNIEQAVVWLELSVTILRSTKGRADLNLANSFLHWTKSLEPLKRYALIYSLLHIVIKSQPHFETRLFEMMMALSEESMNHATRPLIRVLVNHAQNPQWAHVEGVANRVRVAVKRLMNMPKNKNGAEICLDIFEKLPCATSLTFDDVFRFAAGTKVIAYRVRAVALLIQRSNSLDSRNRELGLDWMRSLNHSVKILMDYYATTRSDFSLSTLITYFERVLEDESKFNQIVREHAPENIRDFYENLISTCLEMIDNPDGEKMKWLLLYLVKATAATSKIRPLLHREKAAKFDVKLIELLKRSSQPDFFAIAIGRLGSLFEERGEAHFDESFSMFLSLLQEVGRFTQQNLYETLDGVAGESVLKHPITRKQKRLLSAAIRPIRSRFQVAQKNAALEFFFALLLFSVRHGPLLFALPFVWNSWNRGSIGKSDLLFVCLIVFIWNRVRRFHL